MPFIAPSTKVQANLDTENIESREEKVQNDKRKLVTSAVGVAVNALVALSAEIIFITYGCTVTRGIGISICVASITAALLSVTLGYCGTRLFLNSCLVITTCTLHCLVLAMNITFVACSFLMRVRSEDHCSAMTIGITGVTLLIYLPCCIAASAILINWHRDRGALT